MTQHRRSASGKAAFGIAFASITTLTAMHAHADDCTTTEQTVPNLMRPEVWTLIRNRTADFQVLAGLGPVGRKPDPSYKTLEPGVGGLEKLYKMNLPEDSMDIKVTFQNFTGPGGAVSGQIVCLYRVTVLKDTTSGDRYDTSWSKIYDDLCTAQNMPSPDFEVSCTKKWDDTYNQWRTILDLKQ